LSTNKKRDHKDPKHLSPAVKAGEGVREKAPTDKEKAEGPSSLENEQREQTPLEKVQAELEAKAKDAAERQDQLLRLRAEFENYKKRVQKEKSDLIKFGNESLLKAVLPILDNLERAIDHGKKMNEAGPLLQGVEIILRQFLTFLESFGVKPVAALGEPFDPEKHEAVSQAESDQEPDRVISEMEKGYLFHGRLLRPAKVLVSKARPEKKAETKESK
jgi:molecular chaperone GrpE